MSAKHWRAPAKKRGAMVQLYVTTTDEAVARDSALPTRDSLVEFGRAMTLKATSDDKHFYLAVGAFETHARRMGIADIGKPEHTDQVPEGLAGTPLGGRHGGLGLTVCEDAPKV